MIKSSKHPISYANINKKSLLKDFLAEYRRITQFYVNYFWTNRIEFRGKVFDINNQQYELPRYLPKIIVPQTTLSARALKCAINQARGMIQSAVKKQLKRLYKLKQLQQQNQNTAKLQNKINNTKIIKPNCSNIKAELNSICCDYKETNSSFDGFLQLKSIGKSYGKIRIPIKQHRHSNKLRKQGKQLNSFLITENEIQIRYEITIPSKRLQGKILGADQGIKTILTFSNGTTTKLLDNHGHSLYSITATLARKIKGSKSFARTQEHRRNFINWAINQLNFKGIKQINLERIINIGYKQKRSRFLSHFTNTLIRDKLLDVAEQEGFQIKQQSATYRSQRCSKCGLVCKANRKGKLYKCKCGLNIDSDLNAALNHSIVLPDIPFVLRRLNLNRKGFFWKPEGFYSLTGEILAVSLSDNK